MHGWRVCRALCEHNTAAVYKQELKEVSGIASGDTGSTLPVAGVKLVDLAHREESPTSLSYRKSNQCYKTPRISYTRLPAVP